MTGPEDNKPKKGTAKADEEAKAGPESGERVILHLEEWAEPKGRKVISEFHKPGASELDALLDEEEKSDMDSFADFYGDRDSSKIYSEYHKDGAPYLDQLYTEKMKKRTDHAGKDRQRVKIKTDEVVVKTDVNTEAGTGAEDGVEEERKKKVIVDEAVGKEGEGLPRPKVKKVIRPQSVVARGEALADEGSGQGKAHRRTHASKAERVLDISTIELLTFTVVRALFRKGVCIPIKREGIIDMDIVIKDKDIIFNTNEIMFEIPEMSIWRLVFAYKGRPILEIGRGVKGRVKIHRFRLMMVLLKVWLHKLVAGLRKTKAEVIDAADEAFE